MKIMEKKKKQDKDFIVCGSEFFICLTTTGRLARPHALLRLNSQSPYISS